MLSPDRVQFDMGRFATAAAVYDVVRRHRRTIRGHWRAARSRRSPKRPASPRRNCIICFAAGPASRRKLSSKRLRSTARDSFCAIRQAYSTPRMRSVCPDRDSYWICSSHEAMSPGEWKAGGEGLTISYGMHPAHSARRWSWRSERDCGLAFDAEAGKAVLARHAETLAEGEVCRRYFTHRRYCRSYL
jgi:hypothetical protein